MMNTTPNPVTRQDSATQPAPQPAGEYRPAVQSGPLTGAQRDQVLRLVAAAAAEDGVAPLSEHVMLHLRYDRTAPDQHPDTERDGAEASRPALDLVTVEGGQVTGYAYVDSDGTAGASAELVVDPARRRRGAGRLLLAELTTRAGGAPLRIWAHGDRPAAAALAKTAGLSRVRALWLMHRSLREPFTDPAVPSGITVRTFVPGRDEDRWLRVNRRAFASHPEQGSWTRSDLAVREKEAWFDPGGFFLAERDGRLAGFHWTKVDGDGPGEVYVVGVDPDEQGTGLGRALTLTGLRYLRDERRVPEVILYVDESNQAAIRMYSSLGFTRAATDVMYGAGPGGDPGASPGGEPPEPPTTP
jgi:mycothiol synthase